MEQPKYGVYAYKYKLDFFLSVPDIIEIAERNHCKWEANKGMLVFKFTKNGADFCPMGLIDGK